MPLWINILPTTQTEISLIIDRLFCQSSDLGKYYWKIFIFLANFSTQWGWTHLLCWMQPYVLVSWNLPFSESSNFHRRQLTVALCSSTINNGDSVFLNVSSLPDVNTEAMEARTYRPRSNYETEISDARVDATRKSWTLSFSLSARRRGSLDVKVVLLYIFNLFYMLHVRFYGRCRVQKNDSMIATNIKQSAFGECSHVYTSEWMV